MSQAVVFLVQFIFNIKQPVLSTGSPGHIPLASDELSRFLLVKTGPDPLNVDSLIRQARQVLQKLRAAKKHRRR